MLVHILFFFKEFKGSLFDKYYSNNKFLKIFQRMHMRFFANYFESFYYYLKKKEPKKEITSCKDVNLSDLKLFGFAKLKKINLNDIDFLEKINSNATITHNRVLSYQDAYNFSKKQGYVDLVVKYFKSNSFFFDVVSWNTKVFTDRNAVKTTQWHRDRDGYKTIKFFISLNNINIGQGPTEYAIYSHRIKPIKFVPQIRYKDSEVIKEFSIKKFIGEAGDCYVADTSGLHKGGLPTESERNILVLCFYTGNIYWSEKTLPIRLN
jgi:hypothetical protein